MTRSAPARRKRNAGAKPAAKPRAKKTRGRAASAGKKPRAGRAGPTGAGSVIRSPLAGAWLLAVVTLVSLIYWGLDSGKSRIEPERKVAATHPAGTRGRPPERPPRASTDEAPAAPYGASAETAAPLHTAKVVTQQPPEQAPPVPARQPPLARVAIVIDDFGNDLAVAREFLKLPFPITFSVLPHLAHSKEIADLAARNGRDVILHLPMEPKGYPKADPGPGALFLSMSGSEILRTLDRDLDSNPHAIGVNNHMGSRFTEEREKMRIVIQELQKRGLFFLDSFTTADSIGLSLAQQKQLPTRRRDIFLDHQQNASFIIRQLHQLIRLAKVRNSAIAIGHPHPKTLEILKQQAGLFAKEQIQVVSLSELMP